LCQTASETKPQALVELKSLRIKALKSGIKINFRDTQSEAFKRGCSEYCPCQ
jgi:hypothetical protein